MKLVADGDDFDGDFDYIINDDYEEIAALLQPVLGRLLEMEIIEMELEDEEIVELICEYHLFCD